MFYGNQISAVQEDTVESLYNTLIVEEAEFNKILTSINCLTENEIVLEFNLDTIKEKIGKIWGAVKKFVGIIWKNILKLLKGFWRGVTNDAILPVEVRKPTDNFINMIENKFIPASKDLCDSVNALNKSTDLQTIMDEVFKNCQTYKRRYTECI